MRPFVLAALLSAAACAPSVSETLRPEVAAAGIATPFTPVAPVQSAPACDGGIDTCGFHPGPRPVLTPDSGPPDDGAELVGTKARAWNVDHWMNSAPLTLDGLHGRVVLIRWFMSTQCKFCSATAPTLRAFDERYRSRGLSVIGFYHHKEPEPLDLAKVGETVKAFGFEFPVAIDPDWRTLKDWWLGHTRGERKRRATSVSFLIDKQGTIRFVHPGPEYASGSDDAKNLRAHIEELLDE